MRPQKRRPAAGSGGTFGINQLAQTAEGSKDIPLPPARQTPVEQPDDSHAKARALDAIADRVRSAVQRVGRDIIQIGVELNNAKSLLDHGEFGPWLKAEFGWSERTAQRFMRAAEVFAGKSDTVSHLEPTTIYLLSARSTPDRVRQEVLTRLERGEAMDVEAVRMLVNVARAEAPGLEEEEEAQAPRDVTALHHGRWRNASKEQRDQWLAEAEERQREEEERYVARKAKADAAAAELVDLLRHHLGDQVAKFLELVEAASLYGLDILDIARRLKAELERGRS